MPVRQRSRERCKRNRRSGGAGSGPAGTVTFGAVMRGGEVCSETRASVRGECREGNGCTAAISTASAQVAGVAVAVDSKVQARSTRARSSHLQHLQLLGRIKIKIMPSAPIARARLV